MRRRGGKDLPQPLIAGISVVYYATPERMFVKNTRGKYRDRNRVSQFPKLRPEKTLSQFLKYIFQKTN